MLRPFAPADREAFVGLLNRVRAQPLTAAEHERRDGLAAPGPLPRRIVAELGGRVVGLGQLAEAPYAPPDHLALVLVVDPTARGRGLGTALLESLAAHAPAGFAALAADVAETDAEACRWLELRGFVRHARRFQSVLDLAAFDPDRFPTPAPHGAYGLRIRSMQGADERRWRRLLTFFADRLAEAPDMRGLPRWSEARCQRVLRESPGAEPGWIAIAERGGRQLGLTVAQRAGAEAYGFFTGVAAEARGNGLGRALKVELIRRLRRDGVAVLRTDNLDVNAAALRMNRALGFRSSPGRVEFRAGLGDLRLAAPWAAR